MMNICLFSSYSENNKIDNYVKFYLETLKKHFNEVILITNNREILESELSFLNEINVTIKKVKNEGYDFGMWYKILNIIDVDKYEEIAFVNDSCVLFMSLDNVMDFYNKSDFDFFGITDSNQISHHLQSYFTIARGKNIIKEIYSYYNHNKLINSNDARDIIRIYEIGLSKFLSDNFKIGSMFKYNEYPKSDNIIMLNATDLINRGCPLIKNKLLYNTFREDERFHLINQGFDFNIDYIDQMKKIIYPFNINLEYLLENN